MTLSIRSKIALVSILPLLAGCSVAQRPDATRVTTMQPIVAHTIKADGVALSKQEAGIYPRRDGVVQSLAVDLGDRVEEGQLVAVLQPSRTQSELAAELAYKQRELQIAKDRLAGREGQSQKRTDALSASTTREYDRDLADIDGEIDRVTVEINQAARGVENAAFFLVDTITQMMYTQNDAIKEYGRYGNFDHHRRREVFYPRDGEAKAVETELVQFYRKLSNGEFRSTEKLLDEALALGRESRVIYNNFTASPQLSEDDIIELRDDVDESTDRLITLSTEYYTGKKLLETYKDKKKQLADHRELRKAEVPVVEQPEDLKHEVALIQAEIGRIAQQMGAGNQVKAPFSGVITKRHVNVGDGVDLWRPIYTVVNDSEKFVRFFVTEEIFPYIREGLLVGFVPKFTPHERYIAAVQRIAHSIDPEEGTIQIEADIPATEETDRLLSQMKATIHVPVPQGVTLHEIPQEALSFSKDEKTVWVVNGKQKMEPRKVAVYFYHNGYAYVQDGLDETDHVIIESPVEPRKSMIVEEQLLKQETKPIARN